MINDTINVFSDRCFVILINDVIDIYVIIKNLTTIYKTNVL